MLIRPTHDSFLVARPRDAGTGGRTRRWRLWLLVGKPQPSLGSLWAGALGRLWDYRLRPVPVHSRRGVLSLPHALQPSLIRLSKLLSWAIAWLANAPYLRLCVQATLVAEVQPVGAVVPFDLEKLMAPVYASANTVSLQARACGLGPFPWAWPAVLGLSRGPTRSADIAS